MHTSLRNKFLIWMPDFKFRNRVITIRKHIYEYVWDDKVYRAIVIETTFRSTYRVWAVAI